MPGFRLSPFPSQCEAARRRKICRMRVLPVRSKLSSTSKAMIALTRACRRCFASLFTDRAISYRVDKGFAHQKVALSIAVQRMVRSDLGASGVMFTIDTETGFRDVVLIDAAYGLGENVVQGLSQSGRILRIQTDAEDGFPANFAKDDWQQRSSNSSTTTRRKDGEKRSGADGRSRALCDFR